MAQQAKGGVLAHVFDLVFGGYKTSTTARRIEDGEEATFEIVSGVLGPEFALQASGKPELLQKSQRLLDSFSTQVEQRFNTLNDKLQFAASLGKGFQQELFWSKLCSDAQVLVSMYKEQKLTAALWTARLGLDDQAAMYPVNMMQMTFKEESAMAGLQAILDASRDVVTMLVPALTLVPILRSFALVLGMGSFADAAHINAIIDHPALLAAFEALAGYNDNIILSAAVEAILAAVNLSSCMGTAAAGAQSLADYLFNKASLLAPAMQSYLLLASSGNFTFHHQAAAFAKMLAGVATAYINPLAGFLELEGEPPRLKNSELIAAMSAMRCYPLPEVAQESALFWRILLDSRETSLAWASELRLQEASCLVALTQLPYNCLLEALNNRALLPERLWGGMSSEQQAMLVQWRNMTLEPLLETAGVVGLKQCLGELVGSWARRQQSCHWSHHDALLACINVLHSACQPLGEDTGSLKAVFESLPELPRVGSLPATAVETVRLYTPWATALAVEKPEEGRLILDAFSAFLSAQAPTAIATGEVLAPAAEEVDFEAPQSESEVASETSSLYNSEPHSEVSSHSGEDETALPEDGDVVTGNAEAVWNYLEEGWCAQEEEAALQSQEDDSSAGSEALQEDNVADISNAETRLKPQKWGIWAQPHAVEAYKYSQDEDEEELSELESLSSPADSMAYISDAESSTDPYQEDLQDAAEWESDEELDGMGCPPGWSSQLEGQGSSLVPGPGEMSLEDQSTATSQVAPAMITGAPTRSPYQPPLIHASSGAAPDAVLNFQLPELQALPVPSTEHAASAPDRSALAAQGPSGDEDESGTMDERSRPQQRMPSSESSSTEPGTLLGKIYWAAGAVVGTAQGLASLLK